MKTDINRNYPPSVYDAVNVVNKKLLLTTFTLMKPICTALIKPTFVQYYHVILNYLKHVST
jgi:hypothetical protein